MLRFKVPPAATQCSLHGGQSLGSDPLDREARSPRFPKGSLFPQRSQQPRSPGKDAPGLKLSLVQERGAQRLERNLDGEHSTFDGGSRCSEEGDQAAA